MNIQRPTSNVQLSTLNERPNHGDTESTEKGIWKKWRHRMWFSFNNLRVLRDSVVQSRYHIYREWVDDRGAVSTINHQPLTIALACLLLLAMLIPAYATYETGGVSKVILSNGVTALLHPEPESNVAAVEVFVRLGAADETNFNSGIGNLLAGSILAGTKTRSTPKLIRLASQAGGNFHAVWQWNYMEVYAVTSPENCDEAIALIADSVLNPKLDRTAVDNARDSLLKQFQRQEDDPFNSAYTAVRKLVQSGSPYDRSYLGDADKVKVIRPEELQKFHDYHISADRIVVSVVGNIDPARVEKKIDVCFGNLKRSSQGASQVLPTSSSPSTNSIEKVEKNGSATYMVIGHPAAGLNDPDYPAMCVANILLGGNKSSLLFTNLREKKGLGYQVGSLYPELQGASHLVTYIGIDSARATPETLQQVRQSMSDQIEALRTGKFTDEDLEHAKRYIIGTNIRKRERTRDRAFYLGWNEAVGLGYQYEFKYPDLIKSVTREDVTRVANRFLKP